MTLPEVIRAAPPPVHPEDLAERQDVIAAALAMLREGLVVGMVGNVSRRLGGRILITPSRTPYVSMGPEDLVLVDLEGRRISGAAEPSIELPLHLAVYRSHPEAAAVIHTHSPKATAWSFLGEPLLPETEENRYYGVGPVRTDPPAPAGSAALAEAAKSMGDSLAVLLGGHGVLATGATLEGALDVARVVERQAEIAWLLRNSAS
ncbi:MAG: class II aldolase/adducin family protein [Actinobacteria bacterium]|nr:class II aldolase/adducin family protein [Actinomycetota bacterium]